MSGRGRHPSTNLENFKNLAICPFEHNEKFRLITSSCMIFTELFCILQKSVGPLAGKVSIQATLAIHGPRSPPILGNESNDQGTENPL